MTHASANLLKTDAAMLISKLILRQEALRAIHFKNNKRFKAPKRNNNVKLVYTLYFLTSKYGNTSESFGFHLLVQTVHLK